MTAVLVDVSVSGEVIDGVLYLIALWRLAVNVLLIADRPAVLFACPQSLYRSPFLHNHGVYVTQDALAGKLPRLNSAALLDLSHRRVFEHYVPSWNLFRRYLVNLLFEYVKYKFVLFSVREGPALQLLKNVLFDVHVAVLGVKVQKVLQEGDARVITECHISRVLL